MTDTANLALPCIEGSQAQKHVTHNDALRILDTLVQLAVLDRDLTAPPGAPAEGQRWIVKTGATGAWVGHANAIAAWQDGAWIFSAPQTGWVAFVADEGTLLVWNGTAWGDFFSTVTSIQNLALLGVATTADSTNPLSAKLNNALFAAKTTAEGGSGDLRYKLSKAAAGNTLSFLFQDNYSGRAEIGLTGDDDFHFKVSPDGATWTEGIRIAAATGKVSFPASGGPREMLGANRTYYVRSDGNDGNSGLANTPGGAFLTLQKAVDTAAALDSSIYDVTVQLGAGTYSAAGLIAKSMAGAGRVIVIGDETTPANVVVNATSGDLFTSTHVTTIYEVRGVKLTSSSGGAALRADYGSYIRFQNVEFGATFGEQIRTTAGGVVEAFGNYTISAGASYHWRAILAGVIRVQSKTITLTGTPAFSSAFVDTNFVGVIQVNSNTYSGSATGIRYSAAANSMISSGVTLPGNVAGSTATGGQYI